MTKDLTRISDPDRSEVVEELSAETVGVVFRELAEEHVMRRAGATPSARESSAESIWARIEASGSASSRVTPAGGPTLVVGQSRANGHVARGMGPAGKTSSGRAWLDSGRVWVAAAIGVAALGGVWKLAQHYELIGGGAPLAQSSVASSAEGRVGFEVDGTTVGPDVAGRGRLIASESIPVGIRLSDRSQINLQPHTTLRLAALSDGVVITRMSQGTLDVEVVHQAHTNYQFFAGPFLVKVVGTGFRLSYNPEGEAMDLMMRSGVVEVLDPDGTTRTVTAGQSLHLEATPEKATNQVAESEGVEPADVGQSAADDGLGSPPAPTVGALPSNADVDFHQLAILGKFSEVVRIARAQGIARILATKPADQLQELAQAARYVGQLELAEQVWQRMLVRFSGSVFGQNAQFFLGRIDEQRGSHASALDRYESYLRKSPRGVYSQEAWGRKLQLSQKSRSAELTRQIAQQYLQRFPSGPYAASARSLSGTATQPPKQTSSNPR